MANICRFQPIRRISIRFHSILSRRRRATRILSAEFARIRAECAGNGVARRKKYQCWRAYRVVCVERDAVRSRLQSLLARAIRNPRRRFDLLSGAFIARRIRARFSHGPPERSAARPLPAGSGRQGISSYPHPWLMPKFWQFPTVSMGLGPIMAIYQARFMKYLALRGIVNTAGRKVWAFIGDGETDEPESLGAIGLAGRERLDNLIFVVNCNLQRLDGPVRGNGKIIQELESSFRGAGWRVIKVI